MQHLDLVDVLDYFKVLSYRSIPQSSYPVRWLHVNYYHVWSQVMYTCISPTHNVSTTTFEWMSYFNLPIIFLVDDEYSSHHTSHGLYGVGGQTGAQVGPPVFPPGGALWRGMSGSPPNLASTWNSYHGYGPTNSAGKSSLDGRVLQIMNTFNRRMSCAIFNYFLSFRYLHWPCSCVVFPLNLDLLAFNDCL